MGRGGNDLWLTAHAKAGDLIVITDQERAFKRVKGLKVENGAAQPATIVAYP